MYQQGQTARLVSAMPNQRLPPHLYNSYGQQGPPQHQGHAQHHQSIQPDHSGNVNGGNVLVHHSNYSSGALPNSSPFSSASVVHQNGQQQNVRSQAHALTQYWADQLRLYKEVADAHANMMAGNPHYWARSRATENREIVPSPPVASKMATGGDGVEQQDNDRRKPWSVDTPTNRQDWYNIDLSGQGFQNLARQVCAYTFIQELYINSNNLKYIPEAIGQLRQLRHLDASFNKIVSLPPELGMCTYLKQLLLFSNNIKDLPCELGSLHLLEHLGIEGNPDLDPYLKQEIVERGTKSLINKLRESSQAPQPPPDRELVVIQEDVSSNLEKFKVFSWNVLCDKYATPRTYGYTPTSALNWEYRKSLILREIRERNADFLCLQEITADAFKEVFSPELAMNDYKGVHFAKSRAKTMSEKEAQMVDGCAIFFKATKWINLDKHLIEFSPIAINRPDMKNQHDVFNRVMPRDNIGVVCLFESRQTGARIIVINAHLAWEQIYADVKLIQTGILMERATALAEKYARFPPLKEKDKRLIKFPAHSAALALEGDGEEGLDASATRPTVIEPGPSQEYRNNTDIPLLVCGDLNSTFGSSVYDLLSLGRVPPDHGDITGKHYGNFTRDGIEHPFSLRDAYAHLRGSSDELKFTNYTPGFTDVIDYIWYSTNTVEVVSLLGAPDSHYLKRIPAFPYYHFPADHIQIMAEFVIKARKDKKHPEPDLGSGGGSSNRG